MINTLFFQQVLQVTSLILMTLAIVACATGSKARTSLVLLHAGAALLLVACVIADGNLWPRAVHLALAWAAMCVAQSLVASARQRPAMLLVEASQAVMMVTAVAMSDVFDIFALRRTVIAAAALPALVLVLRASAGGFAWPDWGDQGFDSPYDVVLLLFVVALSGLVALLDGGAYLYVLAGSIDSSDPLWFTALLVACHAGRIGDVLDDVLDADVTTAFVALVAASLAALLAVLGRAYDALALAVVTSLSLAGYGRGRRAAAMVLALSAVFALAASMAPGDGASAWAAWSGDTSVYPADYGQRAVAAEAMSGMPLGMGIGSRIGVWSDVPLHVAPAVVESLRVFGFPAALLLASVTFASVAVGTRSLVGGEGAVSGACLVAMGTSLAFQMAASVGWLPDLSTLSSSFLACANYATPLMQVVTVAYATACGRGEPLPAVPLLPAPSEETEQLVAWLGEARGDCEAVGGTGVSE